MVLKTYEYESIPDHLMNQMIEYIEEGKAPSTFLLTCFSNDLMKACAQADDTNIKIIPVYCHFIHWQAPMKCHGSYEIVDEWLKGDGLKSKNLRKNYWRE